MNLQHHQANSGMLAAIIASVFVGLLLVVLITGAVVWWRYKSRMKAQEPKVKIVTSQLQQGIPQTQPTNVQVPNEEELELSSSGSGGIDKRMHRGNSLIIHSHLQDTKTIPFMLPPKMEKSPAMTRRSLGRVTSRSVDEGGGLSSESDPETVGGKSVDVMGAYALGRIDPSLYSIPPEDDDHTVFPEGHLGRVWFVVEYDHESEKLQVTLLKAKNLAARPSKQGTCDALVRICLVPDERRHLQSRCKRKTRNPVFDESFIFQISSKSLAERTLKLSIFDVDKHKRHHVIGHALYSLADHVWNNESVIIWRDLTKDAGEPLETAQKEVASARGEMLVSLCFNNHMDRLVIGVFEAKNVTFHDDVLPMDTYVKLTLLVQNKVVKTKKTDLSRRSSAPVFNESFTFKVTETDLETASVSLTLMQSVHGAKDQVLGRIIFGSFMFAKGKELNHWTDMISNPKHTFTHWHSLS